MNNAVTRATLAEIRRKSEERRTVTFVASTNARDSYGTVVPVDGWDLTRFNNNGVIGYQHKVYGGWSDTDNPDNVIGKGRAYIEDDQLLVDVEFEPKEINELADKIYRKVMFGSLKAVSVGFLPTRKGSWGKGEEAVGGENPTYYYAGQELLEVSIVNIPANPEALRRSMEDAEAEIARLRAEAEPEAPEVEETETEAESPDMEMEKKKALAIAAALSL